MGMYGYINKKHTESNMKKLNTLFKEYQIKGIDDLSDVFTKSDVARIALELGLQELHEMRENDNVEFYKFMAKMCIVMQEGK